VTTTRPVVFSSRPKTHDQNQSCSRLSLELHLTYR